MAQLLHELLRLRLRAPARQRDRTSQVLARGALRALVQLAADEGLGYRIFLVRRYLAMDVILPYVLWITFLGFTLDWLLRQAQQRFYPWYAGEEKV